MSDHRRRTTIEENVSESLLNSLPTLSQAPQVTFDLNLDNLRHFINEMSNTVNQHSKFLKTLYKDISLKLPSSDIHIILSSISNSIPLQFGGSASNLNT